MEEEESIVDNNTEEPDRYVAWRNSGNIGYVWLCFAILKEAINDYFYGSTENYLSACIFLLDTESDGVLHLVLKVLDMKEIPPFVADFVYGRRQFGEENKEEVDFFIATISGLYKSGKVDYLR